MIKATIDRPKLERSLKRFAREMGETNAQALCRWGVQTCRELASSTRVFGTAASNKKEQWEKIEEGASRVFNIVGKKPKGRTARMINSVEEASKWIDSHRGKRGGVNSLPARERAFITEAVFKKTVKHRRALAGIAKGGWLGAGQEIATAQKGSDRINIGRNFIGYAQKHSRFGSARKPSSGWQASAEISNRARHVADTYVLSKSQSKRAIEWGLKKTVKWYASALRRQNQQQKP